MTERQSLIRASWSRRGIAALAGVTALAGIGATPAFAAPGHGHDAPGHTLTASTQFALRAPDKDAVKQLASLAKSRDWKDASLIASVLATPQADWFTGGTPAQVERQVKQTVRRASAQRTVPVLVVYNIPGRDCSQYSAGGAGSDAAYQAWIDGFVKGLGNAHAVILVEPDGLANLPSDCASAYPGQDIDALTQSRIADVRYAADQLESDPNSLVYLDAGNSAWHNTGDMAQRLYEAGVGDVQGFFLNVSNYQYTTNSDYYGRWVSECLAYATPVNSTGVAVNAGDYADCGNQYWNGGPVDIGLGGPWVGTSMNRYGVWSDTATDPALNTSAVDARFVSELGDVTPTAHFVVDTSRNGAGPNDMSAYAAAPYNQSDATIATLAAGNWCNPPGAGTGLSPQALPAQSTFPLVDAYLWVKTVGESDGQCDIAGGVRAWDYSLYNPWGWDATQQQQNDPLWRIQDPAAGAWFPQQALQLAQLANPALKAPMLPRGPHGPGGLHH